ncbi:MAG TPA: DsrE family protein, partial [Gammaproteobacteria bacterium]
MSDKLSKQPLSPFSSLRRKLLGTLVAGGGLAALGSTGRSAAQDAELRFPGDEPKHKVVYQFNQADEEYQQHVLFSVGAMVRKYGDDIHIVVTCFGPGIHILAKSPKRPVSKEISQRVASLVQYGVEFHACGNTMQSLGWT